MSTIQLCAMRTVLNPSLKGNLCATQGSLAQVADVAGAYFTGAIAVHTFNSLVLHRRLPLWFCFVAVCFGWLAALAMGTVPASQSGLPFANLATQLSCQADSLCTPAHSTPRMAPPVLSLATTRCGRR